MLARRILVAFMMPVTAAAAAPSDAGKPGVVVSLERRTVRDLMHIDVAGPSISK